MLKGPVVKLHIDYIGEATEFDVSPITIATLKGALQPYLDTVVNYVNAPFIAKERGLTYSETKRVEEGAYTNVISMTFQSKDRELTVWGTVFAANKDPRVVRIDGYHVDMKPFGRHLIIKNTDKPGFIGKVGTVLGNAGINVADMTLGRLEKGGLAVTAIAVDGELSDALLKEIRELEYVETLCLVNLGQ